MADIGRYPVVTDVQNSDQFLVYRSSSAKTVKIPYSVLDAMSFLGLNDTPSSYNASAFSSVRVKATEDGLEFGPPPSEIGFADYADTSTQTIKQSIPAGAWTALQNDGLGFTSTGDTYLPNGVTTLYDGTSNRLVFTDLEIGAQLRLRYDLSINPSVNNTSVTIRINFVTDSFSFALSSQVPRLDAGAGIEYPEVNDISFYIGSEEVRSGYAEVQLLCDNPADVAVNGYYIGVGQRGI